MLNYPDIGIILLNIQSFMQLQALSTRPFIGARNFERSSEFYTALGFDVQVIEAGFAVCTNQKVQFYLQDYYVKDWIDNTMIFIEVEDVDECYRQLAALDLPGRFKGARLSPIKNDTWGKECFLHDPSGILWHFGAFHHSGK